MSPNGYRLLADLILTIHVAFVIFVVVGLLLILVGKTMGWSWVRNPWLRAAHLLAIGIVTTQAWAGVICPLTTWEMDLRAKAGDTVYGGSFIAHWLGELLYIEAPLWAFTVAYTLFAGLVVLSWFWVRPRSFRGGDAR